MTKKISKVTLSDFFEGREIRLVKGEECKDILYTSTHPFYFEDAQEVKDEPKVEKVKDEPKVEKVKDEPKVEKVKDEPKVEKVKDEPKVEEVKDESKTDKKGIFKKILKK